MPPNLDTIRDHICNDILNDNQLSIEADQDLLLSGLLDSLSVIRLVAWLEQQCQFSIPAEDVLVEHFGSLQQIVSYIGTRSD